jgi:hypothetical protein
MPRYWGRVMLGSLLTDRAGTGPFLGSHLSDTVRLTADGPTNWSDCFELVQKLLSVRVLSVRCEARTDRSAFRWGGGGVNAGAELKACTVL